jgi:hydroxymethylbilane synthase
MAELVVGTRGSKLALWQTNFVIQALKRKNPNLDIKTEIITTKGDAILDVPLAEIGDKGLFITEIENALLNGSIDFAVHSSKDMPTIQPEGLALTAFLKRATPFDALVSKDGKRLSELKKDAIIATGSLRRKAQLLAYNPDFIIVDIRGNVDTRLKKFDDSQYDAMILAGAGLERLGLDTRITELLSADIMLPAVAQGIVCVETRSSDAQTNAIIAQLNHAESAACALAERAFLRRLEGGCHVPIAAFAQVDGTQLTLKGQVASEDGQIVHEAMYTVPVAEGETLGKNLAEELLAAGAGDILNS